MGLLLAKTRKNITATLQRSRTDGAEQQWNDRNHFLRVAARAMRQITIDYVRAKLTDKRGSGERPSSLDCVQIPAVQKPEMVMALEEGLQKLELEDPRLVSVVECRFFAGLTTDETAAVLEISNRTVERDSNSAPVARDVYGNENAHILGSLAAC
jgi:RNA polymerase sigma factor (TIGR02999 family)